LVESEAREPLRKRLHSPVESRMLISAVVDMSNSELALLRQKLASLETRIKYLEKPLKQQWQTSSKAAQIFAGKMSAYQIRKAILHASSKPEDSTLIAGTHFLIIPNLDEDDSSQFEGTTKNVEYKINIPKWEEWMILNSLVLGTD
jgi:hypothetical protein